MRISAFTSLVLAAALAADQVNALPITQQEDQPNVDFGAQTSTGAVAEKGEGAIAGAAVAAAALGSAAGFGGAKVMDGRTMKEL